jgi:HlyD family secretion protein
VSAGMPLLEIGDPANLELVIDVLSSDAVNIQPGDPIQVLQGAGGRSPQARVQRIEPSAFTKVSALGVEEQRVNVIGSFVDPPTGLGDGYRLDVQIVVWEGKDVVQVPLSALFRCGSSWCVFTARQGRASRQSVTLGQRSQFQTEVKNGLMVGQAVILHPTDRIADGVRISIAQ